ncbi:TetR/AcrR family transcriptional regulator [Streptomyces hoynatensis]|uniref:TetR/AcrR family transcriptional regulator n=1 Tax=Streptomyces hoynatensis TaxID=1141874 RepID=UPI001F4E107B|nr:TetR/AcrR family transcriptional regulator [Streptomyces hoynatensis]
MTDAQPVRRPGGRAARVRRSVHQAVAELLAERPYEEVTIAAVAERSGVHQATVYRRWGTMTALVEDVVNEVLSRESPVPDTGSLRGDLTAYAVKAAADLASPMGAVYLRASALGAAAPAEAPARGPRPLDERGRQLQAMLDRAAARGEPALDVLTLLDVVLAPMYLRLLMGGRPPDERLARTLVDRLLVLAGHAPPAGHGEPGEHGGPEGG